MRASQHAKAAQELLGDEERELMDPASWDWEAIEEGVTVGEPGTIFTMKFSREEHRALAQAARDRGLTTHAFIKQAALEAARVR